MIKVRAIRNFWDLKEKVNRTTKDNDVFEVSPERFEELKSTKYGTLVEKVEEEPEKEPEEEPEEETEEEFETVEAEEVEEETREEEINLTELINLKELKNDELKAMLDKMGIEYKAKATKDELIALIVGD